MKTAKGSAICFFATMLLGLSSVDVLAQKKPSYKELVAEVEKWRQIAEEATSRATKAEAMAVQAQRQAEINEAKVVKSEAMVEKLRYIAQAKAMALKFTELSADPEQQGLIALQAYKFNLQYDGNPFDNDIYNGLFDALVSVKGVSVKSLEGGVTPTLTTSKTGEVFSGSTSGAILRWRKNELGWKSETVIGPRKNTRVFALEVSPEGSMLAAVEGLTRQVLVIYNLNKPGIGARKVSGFSAIKSIACSPQGDYVYVLEEDGTAIKIVGTNDELTRVKPRERINTIALSPDGNTVVGGAASGRIYLWNLKNNFSESVDYEDPSEILAVAFAPDGRRILFSDNQSRILIKVIGSSILPRILTGHKAQVKQILFNNAGTFVATIADDGARIWNWLRQSDPPIVLKTNTIVTNAVFTLDDQQLLIGTDSKTQSPSIHAWPTNSSEMSRSLCSYISRNMTKEEWDNFCGSDLPYEQTCENWPRNNK